MKYFTIKLRSNSAWTAVSLSANFFIFAILYSVLVNTAYASNHPDKAKAKPFAFTTVNIAFVPSGSALPAGFKADNGLAYTTARGYGWVNPTTKAAQDMTASMRIRTGNPDQRLLGVVQMQSTASGQQPGSWEYALPNGSYRITIGVGDDSYIDSDHQLNVEGLPVVADFTPSSANKHLVATGVVTVADGKLTIDATGGVNTKLNFIIIASADVVTDTSAPTLSLRMSGAEATGGAYDTQVQLFAKAIDPGSAGLKTFQYSMNNGAFQSYKAPVYVSTPGNYSVTLKATDANNNATTSAPVTFSVVTPKNTGAYMVVSNYNVFPLKDHVVFSLVSIPWRRTSPDTTPYNANHDVGKVRISNKGVTGNLTVSKLTLSRTTNWKVIAINSDSSAKLPVVIKPNSFVDVAIRFSGKSNEATRVKIFHDTLTISSNDSIAPTKKIVLDGLWQKMGEGLNEPWTQEIFSLYGYKSTTGFNHDDNGIKGTKVVPNTSEVAADYFIQADMSKPVTAYEIDQHHGCCKAVSPLSWFAKGSSTIKTLFTTNNLDGQSVLPRSRSSNIISSGTFNSAVPFGFISDFSMYSDRTKNYQSKIAIRFWKVLDAGGNVVPNAYLAGVDYVGTPFSNSDYNDDIYYIDNIKPATGPANYSTLVGTPSDTDFGSVTANSSKSLSVDLFNSGMTYTGGLSDPSIQIKSLKITGPNASEFSVGAPGSTTINVQGHTTVSVKFNPKTLGIKNAALIISYNNTFPLRIPLYGIANTTTQVVNVVKRYKGGSDADLTVNGVTYTSDKTIRSGSIKLDAQIVKSAVDCTVADALYQTYLSAAADLGVTSYSIPVANGTYYVRMHFVENYFNAENSRIFNVNIENKNSLTDFDIFKEVGYRSALVKDFQVVVADGALSVKFTPTANRVALAALEIFHATPASTVKALATDDALAATADSAKVVTNNAPGYKIIVYPDPSDGNSVNFRATNFKPNERVEYAITDMFGKQIKRDSFTADYLGVSQVSVRLLSKLSKGIYILNSSSLSGAFSTKFVVQ